MGDQSVAVCPDLSHGMKCPFHSHASPDDLSLRILIPLQQLLVHMTGRQLAEEDGVHEALACGVEQGWASRTPGSDLCRCHLGGNQGRSPIQLPACCQSDGWRHILLDREMSLVRIVCMG